MHFPQCLSAGELPCVPLGARSHHIDRFRFASRTSISNGRSKWRTTLVSTPTMPTFLSALYSIAAAYFRSIRGCSPLQPTRESKQWRYLCDSLYVFGSATEVRRDS